MSEPALYNSIRGFVVRFSGENVEDRYMYHGCVDPRKGEGLVSTLKTWSCKADDDVWGKLVN